MNDKKQTGVCFIRTHWSHFNPLYCVSFPSSSYIYIYTSTTQDNVADTCSVIMVHLVQNMVLQQLVVHC